MKFSKVQFVYIDIKYLEYMNSADSEIFFDKNNEEYKLKPHLGILLNNDGKEYVIPLTSAKEKHMTWKDVTADWYRIYEIIDTRTVHTSSTDVIVDIKNQDILKNIALEEQPYFKQRILSVLDIRKMFPIKKGVYTEIQFNLGNNVSKEEKQRNALMLKEYLFLDDRKDKIEEKATKIYDKQVSKGKVLPYCCDFKKLEKACDEYEV